MEYMFKKNHKVLFFFKLFAIHHMYLFVVVVVAVFFFNILIGVQLLYNGSAASVVQQSESDIHKHTSPHLLPPVSPPYLPHPTPPGGHKVLS